MNSWIYTHRINSLRGLRRGGSVTSAPPVHRFTWGEVNHCTGSLRVTAPVHLQVNHLRYSRELLGYVQSVMVQLK